MATFDPQFKTQDDKYWNWFKPAEQPLSDKSTGIALETLGRGIEGASELADTTVKDVIKKQLDDEITQKKDEFIQQLGDYQNKHGTPKPLSDPMNANAQASDQDLMPDKPDVPSGIQRGLQTVQNIQNAREQSGKMRTTSLDANLLETLKRMRSQYPGYTDYIDAQGSRIVGYNVANKLISDKISEINEQKAQSQRTAEYWEKKIVDSGYDGWQKTLSEFKRTGDVSKVELWYGTNTESVAKVDRGLKEFALTRAIDENNKTKAERALTEAATHAVTSAYVNKNLTDDASVADIQKKMYDLAAHPELRNDEAIANLGIQLEGMHARNRAQVDALMRSVVDKDGRNIYQTLGPQRYNEIMDSIDGQVYNTTKKLLTDKDLGLLGSTQRSLGYVKTTSAYNVLKDPTVGGIARTAAALNDIGPNIFTPEVMALVYGKMGNIADDLLKVNQEQLKQGVAQTGGLRRSSDGSLKYTFDQAQEETARAVAATSASPSSEARAYKNFIELHKAMLEPNPKVQDNAMSFFFEPSNMGTLNKFMDDFYDHSRGALVEGRTSAFQDLTSEGVTKAVAKRDKEGNKGIWDKYKNWALHESAANLSKISKTWNDSIADQNNPLSRATKFAWDNETHRLIVMDNNGVIPESSWRFNVGLMAARNANKYFESLTRIAHEEGKNPDELIFQTLKQAWPLDPESQKIFKAIASSYTKPKEEPEKKSKAGNRYD